MAEPRGLGLTGVIGVGNMGLGMVRRLRQLGLAVRAHDIAADREALAAAAGATLAPNPAVLASGCEAVLVVVVDAIQVRQVLFGPQGLVQARPKPATVLLCPTISPAEVEAAARELSASGIACIDAPMSGGPARAGDGSMSLMLAAEPALLARHQALLDALSNQQVVVSPRVGDGARTKLVNNLLAAINLAGAAECLALAQRLGLDPNTTLQVMERSSGQSWIGSDRLRRALAGDLAPRAHTALLAKDSALALRMAAAAGLRPALGEMAAAEFACAAEGEGAGLDDAQLYERALRRFSPGPAASG